MLTLHHLENSQSIRLVWLLHELGLEFEIKKYPRDKKTKLAPKDFKDLHPLGTSPLLQIEDNFLPETNAIVDYLLTRYSSNLRPEEVTQERDHYDFWIHSVQASLMPSLLISFLFHTVTDKVPFFLKPLFKGVEKQVGNSFYNPRLNSYFKMMDSHLEKNQWLAGTKFTAADIVMSYSILVAEARCDLSQYKNILKYIQQIKEHPGFVEATKKSGGFSVKF